MLNQTFWDKHKVFLLGLLASISLAIEPMYTNASAEVTYKMLGYAVASAALSFFAKEWRGQGLSILGIMGNLAVVGATVFQSGNVSIPQLLGQFILAIAMAAGADPKSRGYENSATIVQAKIEGEVINPAPLTNALIKGEAKAIIEESKTTGQ